MNCQPNIWDGGSLGPGPVSLFLCETAPEECDRLPDVMFGGASNGTVSVGVLREQLSAFIRSHGQVTLVCYDAASLHWLVHDHLQSHGGEDALPVLWNYSEDCR